MSPQCPHCKTIFDDKYHGKFDPELCLHRIEEHVTTKAHRWVSTIGALIAIIVIVGGGLGLWASYLSLRDQMTKEIRKRFADETVQLTLHQVAKDQAKDIIEKSIQPHAEDANKEIAGLRAYIKQTQEDFSDNYKTLTKEIQVLKERNRLMFLADKAIAGDARAWDELLDFSSENNDLRLSAIAQIYSVKSFYLTIRRQVEEDLNFTNAEGVKLRETDIPTELLVETIKKSDDWRIRYKCVRILGKRRESVVPQTLLHVAQYDPNLDNRKCALESFEQFTHNHFHSKDVLDPSSAKVVVGKEQGRSSRKA